MGVGGCSATGVPASRKDTPQPPPWCLAAVRPRPPTLTNRTATNTKHRLRFRRWHWAHRGRQTRVPCVLPALVKPCEFSKARCLVGDQRKPCQCHRATRRMVEMMGASGSLCEERSKPWRCTQRSCLATTMTLWMSSRRKLRRWTFGCDLR